MDDLRQSALTRTSIFKQASYQRSELQRKHTSRRVCMSFSLKPNVCKRFLGLTKIFAISGLKSVYSPASAAYSQPPVPRQVATLKPPPAPSSVSSSYTIYPTSTSVQQTPAPISTYTPSSTFNSTVATSYSGTSAASKNILQ